MDFIPLLPDLPLVALLSEASRIFLTPSLLMSPPFSCSSLLPFSTRFNIS